MRQQQIFMIGKRRVNKEDMMEITDEFFRMKEECTTTISKGEMKRKNERKK